MNVQIWVSEIRLQVETDGKVRKIRIEEGWIDGELIMINTSLLRYVDYTIIKVYLPGFSKSLTFYINETIAWSSYNEGIVHITFKHWIAIILLNQNAFSLVNLVAKIVIICGSWRNIALLSVYMEGFINLGRIFEESLD